jgi:hypothetical protein
MFSYVCMYVCMYVRTYVCIMYVSMFYVRTFVCVCARVYVCMCVCACVCMYVCMYVRTYVWGKQGMRTEFLKGKVLETVHLTLDKQIVTLKERNLKDNFWMKHIVLNIPKRRRNSFHIFQIATKYATPICSCSLAMTAARGKVRSAKVHTKHISLQSCRRLLAVEIRVPSQVSFVMYGKRQSQRVSKRFNTLSRECHQWIWLFYISEGKLGIIRVEKDRGV